MADAAAAEPTGPASERAAHDRLLIPLILGVVLIPAVLGSSTTIFNDGDVSWHIATGQWILAHHAIPRSDPFSFTWAGKPWVPFEWLADLLYAAAYRLAGYGGIAALATAAMMGLHALVFANGTRFVRPFVVVAVLVLMDVALIPMMLARPHLLVWPLLALWTWLMVRAREQDRAPPLAAALLIAVWANLHGSFVLGVGIAAVFGFEALVFSPDRARALRQWLPFGILCLAAIFLNVNGVAGVLYPFHIANLDMLPLIKEWNPSSPKVTPWFFAVLAIVVALVAWRRPRLRWTRWLLLAGCLGLAMLQMRHQAMLAIVTAMVLPEGFRRNDRVDERVDRRAVAIASAAAALLVVARAILPLNPPENEANPWKLIASVPPQYRTEPVLNGYSMGGPLILSGIRPFIDGRSDMYGDELVAGYMPVIRGDPVAFASTVRQWNIGWTILPHRDDKLIGLLDRLPDWRRIASDQAGVVYVRTASSASGSPRAPR